MADLSQMLSELLNSPDGMQKLQNAAASLGIADSGDPPQVKEAPAVHTEPKGGVDLSALGDLSMLTKIMPLMSDFKKEDENTRLLNALRPYIQNERKEKLDQSIKIIRLLKLLPLINGGDLF